jgi:hypothetical protein
MQVLLSIALLLAAPQRLVAKLPPSGAYLLTTRSEVVGYSGQNLVLQGTVTGKMSVRLVRLRNERVRVESMVQSVNGSGQGIFDRLLQSMRNQPKNRTVTQDRFGSLIAPPKGFSFGTDQLPPNPAAIGSVWNGTLYTGSGRRFAIQNKLDGFQEVDGVLCAKVLGTVSYTEPSDQGEQLNKANFVKYVSLATCLVVKELRWERTTVGNFRIESTGVDKLTRR